MKKILTVLSILCGLSVLGQTPCVITVFDQSDTTKLAGVSVNINFTTQNLKGIEVVTDSNGSAKFNLPESGAFNLLITKDGYKPLSYVIAKPFSKLFVYLKPLIYDGEEVTVAATRAGTNSAATFSLVTKKELAIRNFGQDIPILLQNTPSVVVTSDAGAGIGYTGLRIRGIDPTRINVTINGVPLNDAESQGVFWVNMPDLVSGIENIQIQRGVGTSTNGAGAFGASINIKTDMFSEIPFAKISLTQGSFNTSRQSLKFGTGRMNDNWYAEGRISWIKSDGYINRASSDLSAWNFSLGRKTVKSLFKVIVFSGREKTYQAWLGVPMAKYKGDTLDLEDMIKLLPYDSLTNYFSYDSLQASQIRSADKNKYNYYTSENETDNYEQSHLQIIYNRRLTKNRNINFVLHGTLGKGYYENFENKTPLGLFTDTPVISHGQSFYNANLAHQRWLDNSFAGFVLSYNSIKASNEQTIGASANIYKGRHFGKVIWHEFMKTMNESFNYYDNRSLKTDANVYWKLKHQFINNLSGFVDMQLRHAYYEWFGPGQSGSSQNNQIQQNTNYTFLNPKVGLQYQPKKNILVYFVYGRGSHEPIRDDFINSSSGSRPGPEFLNNIEAAFKSGKGDWKYSVTGYYMGYINQLALSGKINDVGGYSRINIPRSYRTGIELELALDISTWVNLNFNFSLSQNKVKKFTEFVDDYTNGGQVNYEWENTDMALSPNQILGSQLSIKASKTVELLILTKYVGRQYLDNTETKSRSLDPALINDLVIQFNPKIKHLNNFKLCFLVNNIGNSVYTTSGYTYSGIFEDSRKDFSFVYPQAGINFLGKIEIGF